MSEQCCSPLQVGKPAPAFKATAVVGSSFQPVSYADGVLTIGPETFRNKYLVLFFYPLDFTFVCPTEIIAFSDRLDEFEHLGAKVLGVSVDSQYSHLAWKNMPRNKGGVGEVRYPLLADVEKRISRDYNVLLDGGVAARGLFIIDGRGILQSYTVNNLAVGRSVDEALRLIQGYQYVEQHGEVCPANWKPGDKSMKADPEGSQEYFKTVK
ncbi:MAG: peroxiredoxin [Phycisphaerae bacterium]|jgi:peroxiredoxin (alkyl hydroperoxide reductase subunit C)